MKAKMPKKLKNRYFVVRHGESEANVKGILLSNPEEGISSFGLSEKGKSQVKKSISRNKLLDSDVIIYSSDFLRTKETAEIIKDILNTKNIIFHKNLRERYFGKLDKTSLSNLKKVWMEDKINPKHKYNEVENPDKVLKRTVKLILELEKKFENKKILLVSHGDVLQILFTYFLNKSPSLHREIPHLETAEIRELTL